ncbi:hypothetical protein PBI_COOPER_88 [Mycobacterium phage Cooper]|uniref:Uncharacterized protein n=2 Tax=Coopervirus TaxID=1982898 RepID=G1BLE5_9CAUD|nr:hypothetical protein FDI63_gp088 [Mycobacterium phage ChrisnMich]YP_654985.1 gp88 [Mycobacterium phage Cooper]ABD58205.1 hypothetical protein PBI_COOPER_88 [Mycobacterium phage Cooper]AEJ94666.1 hypothetical protein CHRISNMICH_88 [Mycobacterium phage ChrisnMich]
MRCPGSGKAPARTFRGHAYCAVCGKHWAERADGMVRRHAIDPSIFAGRSS